MQPNPWVEELARWGYLWQETWRGWRRGGWLNGAAIATVAVSLFLLGASLQAAGHLEGIIERFGNQLEVSAYLQPSVRATDLEGAIAQLPGVSNLKIVPRETAWAELLRDLGGANIERATQQLEGNPLVDEIKVTATSPEAAPALAERLRQMPGVADARYVDEVVLRLRDLDRLVAAVSGGVTTLLVAAAVATTLTTIRLVVTARAPEIEIAQLVGATRSWIYGPFLLQGVLFGAVGAAIAAVAIAGLQQGLAGLLAGQPAFLQFLARELPLTAQELLGLLGILLLTGGAIGLLGSGLAVRHLRSLGDD